MRAIASFAVRRRCSCSIVFISSRPHERGLAAARNADEIASFLAAANPRSWGLDEMKTMLHEHLRLTANEAIARIQGDWAADVAAYDQIHLQALGMADMLSNGIVKQFPARFH